MSWRYLTLEEVVRLHQVAMLDEGQTSVLIARDKLESALARPSAEAFGEEFYPTLAEKAAALLQGLVIAHPFMDGNKRIGLAAMIALLRQNGVRTIGDQDALYDLTIAVATGDLREVSDIAPRVAVVFGL